MVVFNNDGSSVTILTTCNENEEEFKSLENLYNSQNPEYLLVLINIIKFKSLKNLDFIKFLECKWLIQWAN